MAKQRRAKRAFVAQIIQAWQNICDVILDADFDVVGPEVKSNDPIRDPIRDRLCQPAGESITATFVSANQLG